MTSGKKEKAPVEAVDEIKWGETREDHLGYQDEADRISKRGLEDWEMVEKMSQTSDHRIPYWFFALFFLLLIVATGLTFPFWGVRPGFERSWFDWGIPGGVAWVVTMSIVIYYFVDYRHRKRRKPGDEGGEDRK